MVNKFKEIVEFFQNHPKFPFNRYYSDYDEYVASNLMILNIIKSYIPKNEINNWEYAMSYYDFRRLDREAYFHTLMCQNRIREQVFLTGLVGEREYDGNDSFISVRVERDDFYGGKWEENLPIEEWYSVFQIDLDFRKAKNFKEIDHLLKTYFERKLSFDELLEIQARFEDSSDE